MTNEATHDPLAGAFRLCTSQYAQFRSDACRYSVHELDAASRGMAVLRSIFPDGEADALNMVLFSTSGTHGNYATIEDVEADRANDIDDSQVTFLVLCPRVVSLRFGNCVPQTPDDFAFLKSLRTTSQKAFQSIGIPQGDA
jgi:hypothetical protein